MASPRPVAILSEHLTDRHSSVWYFLCSSVISLSSCGLKKVVTTSSLAYVELRTFNLVSCIKLVTRFRVFMYYWMYSVCTYPHILHNPGVHMSHKLRNICSEYVKIRLKKGIIKVVVFEVYSSRLYNKLKTMTIVWGGLTARFGENSSRFGMNFNCRMN